MARTRIATGRRTSVPRWRLAAALRREEGVCHVSDGLMSQADYARHRGVSRQAVHKLVKAGKIPLHGSRLDPAEADFALGETRERIDAPRLMRSAPASFMPESSSAGLTKARTASEVYRAKVAELEYNQRVGRLVAIDDVTRSMERCAEAMVRDLEQLPSRADDLAAAFTRGGSPALRQALKDLGREMRRTLADSMRLLGRDEDGDDSVEEAA
jgi:hypothetical protein